MYMTWYDFWFLFCKMLSLWLLVTFYKANTALNEVKKITSQMDSKSTPNNATPAEHTSVVEANTCYRKQFKPMYLTKPPIVGPELSLRWSEALFLSSFTSRGQRVWLLVVNLAKVSIGVLRYGTFCSLNCADVALTEKSWRYFWTSIFCVMQSKTFFSDL